MWSHKNYALLTMETMQGNEEENGIWATRGISLKINQSLLH